jgi:hypothetical protein
VCALVCWQHIPLTLILAWASAVAHFFLAGTGAIGASLTRHSYLVGGFAILRILHTVAYMSATTYLRPLFWAGSQLCAAGLATNMLALLLL